MKNITWPVVVLELGTLAIILGGFIGATATHQLDPQWLKAILSGSAMYAVGFLRRSPRERYGNGTQPPGTRPVAEPVKVPNAK